MIPSLQPAFFGTLGAEAASEESYFPLRERILLRKPGAGCPLSGRGRDPAEAAPARGERGRTPPGSRSPQRLRPPRPSPLRRNGAAPGAAPAEPGRAGHPPPGRRGAGRARRRRGPARRRQSGGGSGAAAAGGPAMVGLKEELLKSIWHAFTALDLDRSGKVSKSQLKASGAARPGGGQRGGRGGEPRGRGAGLGHDEGLPPWA